MQPESEFLKLRDRLLRWRELHAAAARNGACLQYDDPTPFSFEVRRIDGRRNDNERMESWKSLSMMGCPKVRQVGSNFLVASPLRWL